MATPGQLVRVIAETTGAPHGRVVSAHRYLREAGLVSQGGRGTSAARMTYLDAANIIMAVAMADEIKDSASTVNSYAPLVASKPLEFEGGEVRGQTFGDALAALLEAVPAGREHFSGEEADWVLVSLFGPRPVATIELSSSGHKQAYEYEAKSDRAWPSTKGAPPQFADLQFISRFTQITLGYVGDLVGSM